MIYVEFDYKHFYSEVSGGAIFATYGVDWIWGIRGRGGYLRT